MLDNRERIPDGGILEFEQDNHYKYRILGEVGRGASCLVYSAYYIDLEGFEHEVRIKECYPYGMDIKRDFKGDLAVSVAFHSEFEGAKERFRIAYERNVDIKRKPGLANSTVNSMGIYFQHNTWYSVMSYTEGIDYGKITDECLQDIFVRMITLSKIIQKYHQNEILHLDIKPENMLIVPETKERMVLYDFDSMVSKEQLKKKQAIQIAFSDGYAAPELVQGKLDKVCEATDIYSIGAVIFYKLFDRKPTVFDREADAKYDYRSMKYADSGYPLELYREVSDFFHKTISSCVRNRYQQIEDVVKALEKLAELADVKQYFLKNNFSYNSPDFVGRTQEILDIDRAVADNRVIFVSGIGGIGKTEIVKRYAHLYQEKFHRVVFVSFNNSIMETVCGSDIRINGLKRGEESENEFFESKLEILKDIVIKDDLIILDNFDIEEDDDLDRLFECPCKFLVTTREDFRDYNYRQINIDKMKDMNDVMRLFDIYNSLEYGETEKGCIEYIIQLVERHTMTVELIAKYLKNTGELPSVLLKKMMEKEGITSVDDSVVKHRKDGNRKEESVDKHLQILFDLSDFSTEEYELIKSLSLLGYVRILKEYFLTYCATENNKINLENLIKRGWIEYDRVSRKISMHQIILDLVYNHMHPTAETCPHIVFGMKEYAERKSANKTEEEVKRQLLDCFIERTEGQNIEYAALLVSYCIKIQRKRTYLYRADEICKKSTDIMVSELMQKICILQIRDAAQCEDMFGIESDELESDKCFDDYFIKKFGQIYILANRAYDYTQKCSYDQEALGRFCIKLAYEIDNAVEGQNMYFEKDDTISLTLEQLYRYADDLLKKAEECFKASEISNCEKVKLFEKIQEFYAEDDFGAIFYRSRRDDNFEKSLHIQTILDELREEIEEEGFFYSHIDDISYFEYGKKAEREGEYEKAIQFYLKSIERDEESYQITYEAIADVYKKKGNLNKAIESLKKILDIDKDDEEYTSYICVKLVSFLISQNMGQEAVKYLKELALYNAAEENGGDNFVLSYLLYADYWLYKLEKDLDMKKDYWNKCLEYYQRVEIDNEVMDELIDFIMEYISLMREEKMQIEYVFFVVDKIFLNHYQKNENAVRLLSFIIKKYENNEEHTEDYIRALMMTVENFGITICSEGSEDMETALRYCERAFSVYEKNRCNNEYLKNFILKNLGDCYECNNDPWEYSVKRNCDYYLFAQGHVKGKSKGRKIDIWKNAADEYSRLKNWELAEKCYKEIFDLYDLAFCQYDEFEEYWRTFINRIKGLVQMKNQKLFIARSEKLLNELIYYELDVNCCQNHEDKANAFSEKLQEIADYFVKMDKNMEAFNLYILSIIVAVGQIHDRSFFENICADFQSIGENIQKEFVRVLQGPVTERMVDIIMRVNEKIQQLGKPQNLKMEYHKIIREFSETHKYRYVEFKRESYSK